MVHPYRRRPKQPERHPAADRIRNFINMSPSGKVTAALHKSCRELLDDGVRHDEIANALFRIGSAYLKAANMPLESGFRITAPD
jgi:hypothetical protein